jgi:hypothetical protein
MQSKHHAYADPTNQPMSGWAALRLIACVGIYMLWEIMRGRLKRRRQ